jgi:hypothetical protein
MANRNLSLVVTTQLYEGVHEYAAAHRMTIRKVMDEALSGIGDVTVDDISRERILQLTVESDADMNDMTSALTEEGYELLSQAALDLRTNRRMLMRVLLRKHVSGIIHQEQQS